MKENEISKFISRNILEDKKAFFIKKINIASQENKPLYNNLEKFFNDEQLYFNTNINGNKIVLGKINKNKDDFLFKLKKHKFFKFLRPLKTNKKSSKTYKSNSTNNLKSSSSRKKSTIYNEKKTISDLELNNIFEQFKIAKTKLKKQNSVNLSKSTFKSTRPQFILKKMLSLQEGILDKENDENIKKIKLEKKISQSVNRNENESIMNNGNAFRIIKELKEKTNNENENNRNYYYLESNWLKDLRKDSNNKTNNIKDIFINTGSLTRPNFKVIYKKLDDENEKIRSGFNYLREIDKKNFLKNNYLINRIDYLNFKNSFNELSDIKILGKNLLDCEIENAKFIKGKKKVIYKNNPKAEEIDNRVFYRSNSVRDFFNTRIIDNCYKLHN